MADCGEIGLSLYSTFSLALVFGAAFVCGGIAGSWQPQKSAPHVKSTSNEPIVLIAVEQLVNIRINTLLRRAN
jgi:hypothetical protein